MESLPIWEPVARTIDGSVRDFLSDVHVIWDEIGLSTEIKAVRFKQASEHVQDLIQDMLCEAKASRNNLVQEVQQLMSEAGSLSKELQTEIRTTGYEDLPFLEVKAKILNQLQKLRSLKQQRLDFTKELLEKEHEICQALGSVPMGLHADIPSESELKSFKLYLDKIEAEKIRMEATFKSSQRAIIEMMDELKLSPSVDFENNVYNKGKTFILNTENMAKLRELYERLEKQIQEAKQEAEEKKTQLQELWRYLEEPADKCQQFLERNAGYDLVVLRAFDEEIKRCKQKRSQNIAKYVEKIRCQIQTLWEQCHIGEGERKAFLPMQYQTFTEDLLILHEMEAEKLRKYYDDNRSIFELLEERENLWQKMSNLEQRATDPNRFHNRGGQLLAEEKERKVIQKKLPKIEEEILDLAMVYEEKSGKTFTICGVPLSEALKRSWEDYLTAKQAMMFARKQARDQSTVMKKTPLSVSKRTPSAMSMRRPSPANSAQKKAQGDLTPFNPSRKRRNRSNDSNRVTVSASKIKRGRASRRIFASSSKNSGNHDNENHVSDRATESTSTSISSYGEFQEHLENREELRSSVLPRQILKNSNNKPSSSTRIKTPMKPLRKNLTSAGNSRQVQPPRTPGTPRSPKTESASRLAPAPGNLPFIF